MANQHIVEARSFDFVPEAERHGNVRSQFQLWFMINATVITLYTGAVGPLYQLDLTWTLVAVVLGSVFGTMFQAFHGAQGPRMGLPQMIQSRVQFGSRGAILPLVAAMISQFGFAIFLIQTGSQALVDVSGSTQYSLLQVIMTFLAVAIAIVGYNLVLRVEKLTSYAILINLVLLTVAAVAFLPISSMFSNRNFALVPFLAQFGASAIYQLAIAPIVSDYTRYLPSRTSGGAVSAAVFFGTLLSAVWLEGLGAALSIAFPGADVVTSLRDLGNHFGLWLGFATMIIAAGACLITAAITFYSGTVALLSAAEAFRPIRSTALLRSVTIVVASILVIITSLSLPSDVLGTFAAFLSILGYFLIPWTAVNLIDYYYVRRGKFSITDIMRPDGGIYGRWGKAGMASYMLGFLAMVPFFSTPLYTGPIAVLLGKADVSFAVGLTVSIVSYLLMMQRHDFDGELQYIRSAPLNTLEE